MALVVKFSNTKFPSGSGPKKCQKCGGSGWVVYGLDMEGKFRVNESCFDCPKLSNTSNTDSSDHEAGNK